MSDRIPLSCIARPGTLTAEWLAQIREDWGADYTPLCAQCGGELQIGDTIDHYAPHMEDRNRCRKCPA